MNHEDRAIGSFSRKWRTDSAQHAASRIMSSHINFLKEGINLLVIERLFTRAFDWNLNMVDLKDRLWMAQYSLVHSYTSLKTGCDLKNC